MLVMYREFSKNPLYTLIGYLHDGCPILDFHHTRLIDHTRLLDTQEYPSVPTTKLKVNFSFGYTLTKQQKMLRKKFLS